MKKKNVPYLLLLSLLCACGGGGGGTALAPEPALPAPAPAPVEEEPSTLEPVPDEAPVADNSEQDEAGEPGEADFAVAGYAPPPEDDPKVAALDAPASFRIELVVKGPARLYVSPKGKDSNAGTASQPLRSIARAAKLARPGTTVLVAPGAYSGGFRTSVSGTAGARIAFVSTTKWGASIVPPSQSPNRTAWDNRGSHVDIVGFHIDGSRHQGGIRWTQGIYNGGSYDVIRNNHVHHIAREGGCTRAGGAAIGVDSYYRGVQAQVIANLVHDIGPAGCRFVQGIYVSTSGQIKNNVVYRVSEGGIHLWHDARDVIITNNTVTASNTGIIVGGGNNYHASGPNDHTAVYSNIVYDNKMGISEQGRTEMNNTYRNNLVYRNATYDWQLKNGLKHEGTVSSAPGFVADARSSTPNLKPGRGSPAIGRATPQYAENTDFDGRPRNARAGYDIGAYQH